MIKGTEVELNGQIFIVPPLNLSSLEMFQDKLANYSGGIDVDSVRLVADVAHAAIRRNYPDVTLENVKDWIDLANLNTVFSAVMNVSGLTAKAGEQGEALAPVVA